jgi:V/A-type H+-transporting ATPase subunit I
MIVPMKKYGFLVFHSDYKNFLNGIRKLGVLHVRQRPGEPSEELMSSIQLQKDIREVLHVLRQRATTKKEAPELSVSEGLDMVVSFREFSEELENLHQELGALQKEIDFLRPWGDFSAERLAQLQAAGLHVRFFVCPQKKYRPAWEESYLVEVINTVGADTYFVVITRNGEAVSMEAEEIPPPETALSRLTAQRDALQKKTDAIDARLDRYAEIGQPALEAALRETEDTTQLISVIESTQKKAEGSLMLLEGFAPVTREAKLIEFCDSNDIPFLSEKPEPEDTPPILLKNSAFARLFEPIGKLFSLPGYRELDLTPFFAPFFMMFFGLCLGDAGYGLVVLLGATLYKARAKDNRKPVLSLAQWLGVATIVFGALTGTFFGLNLLEEQFAFLGRLRRFMLDSDKVFQLALALGMVQILFGLFVKASNQIRQFGLKYAIATYGWVILILSLLDLGFLKLTGSVSTYTSWLGVALIILFNDPKAGLFGRLGKGLWELYGITGIFGDLLSYIRLFALGISSAILGYVVNDIAIQIKGGIPYLGPVLFVVFLLVGHGANLLIASLGAFVHPMRLTFVEFYKNAGFTGGGKPYRPLSSRKND